MCANLAWEGALAREELVILRVGCPVLDKHCEGWKDWSPNNTSRQHRYVVILRIVTSKPAGSGTLSETFDNAVCSNDLRGASAVGFSPQAVSPELLTCRGWGYPMARKPKRWSMSNQKR